MNKLVPFSQISKLKGKFSFLKSISVVVNQEGVPMGFVFGRDSFITLLELMDEEFEKRSEGTVHENPAGKLIDVIEEKLPLNPKFVKELKEARKVKNWIPLREVAKSLHV